MSDTINIGGIQVSKFYLGGSSDVKIYLGSTKLYPHLQEPCFAVVDNISTYTARTYVDVYETSSDKWYKLNNLDEYEEYGVYGSGRTITYYDGKLTIDGDYEYTYSGSAWVNIGEVSGSSITIKSPEYLERDASHTGYCDLLETLTEDTKIIIKHRQTNAGGYAIIGDYYNTDNDDWRIFFASSTLYYDFITQRKSTGKTIPMQSAEEWEIGNYYIKNTATGTNYLTGNTQTFSSRPNQMYLYYLANAGSGPDYGEVYYIKIFRNDVLVRDFIPWTDMNGNYGLYDKVENQLVHTTGQRTASTVINDVEIGSVEYPLYYPVKQDPPSSVTFSSMTEAESYECPYVGLPATIAGDNYIFSGDSQSGYEWVYNPSRLPVGYTEVEYVENTGTSYFNTNFTPNQNTRVVMQYQMVTDSGAGRFWGAGAWNSATGIEPNYENGYLQISWLGKTSWTKFNNVTADYNKHTLDLNKNYLYLDETLVGSNTYTTRTASDPIGVFTYIGGGRPSSSTYWGIEHFKGKMFSFQIYDNGTLVRDLVPCIKDSDNTVGAYDIVNDVFYTVPTGYTTDKLVAGDPVI